MTADPMVPDEAVEAAMKIAYPGLQTTGQPSYKYARKYVTRMLAAAMPALTAAVRAEVAASVKALADELETSTQETGPRRRREWAERFRAAVSDDGVAAHNQQMRAEAWDEGYRWAFDEEFEDVRSLNDNPYRAEAASNL